MAELKNQSSVNIDQTASCHYALIERTDSLKVDFIPACPDMGAYIYISHNLQALLLYNRLPFG